MNKAMYQHLLEAARRINIETNESARFRGRGVRLHKHFELPTKSRSLSIFNESNAFANDNIGVSDDSISLSGQCNNSPSASKADDDGGGDPDPEPERKRRACKRKTVTEFPQEGYVRLWQILSVLPISKSTWWAGCKSGRFPQSIKFGPRTTVWRVSDIRELIEARGAQ